MFNVNYFATMPVYLHKTGEQKTYGLFSRLFANDVYFRRRLLDPAFIYLAPAFYSSLVFITQVDFFISLVNN